MTDPKTPDEWRACVAFAEAALLLDAARQYGLVVGGPAVNVDRCHALLARGAALGYVPTQAATDAAVLAIVRGAA